MRSSQLSAPFSSKEVSCSPLEAFLHNRAVVVAVVFFSSESLFLDCVKALKCGVHAVAHRTHHLCATGTKTVPGLHHSVVLREFLISVTSRSEDGWVRDGGASEGGPVIVHNACVIFVDLKSLKRVLIRGGCSIFFVLIVHGFVSLSAPQEILLAGFGVDDGLVDVNSSLNSRDCSILGVDG